MTGKTPGKARREGWGGVSVGKGQAQISLMLGLQLFATKKSVTPTTFEKSSLLELLIFSR
ncbi:hypothetical protein DMR_09940 [Solidesulfovibrio magneticus RS-1]|uniref:Uncharacterized protein n=1 Tax=Solidesulfovibrio magneticus (strain ATCC 700980 / DSM 13731 / RS-1) TaxID=573370 RepID=C4XKU6_SOLM1|nr:hypothetical protein DMR_09940 [Solidesulfovibrio magneticus RS-1]